MGISIFIAKIIGPLFFVIAVSMLLNRSFFMKVIDDYCQNSALIYFTAIFPLAFGVAVVSLHNVWVADWRVIVTIFGWISIVKGVTLLLFPAAAANFMKVYKRSRALWTVHSIVAIVLGFALTFLGYFG